MENDDKTIMIFNTDYRFLKNKKKYYSNGIFINDNLNRYTDVFYKVNVISRIKEVEDVRKLDEITNGRVEFLGIKNLREIFNRNIRKKIEEEVKKSNYVITRGPGITGMLVMKYVIKYKKNYLIEVVGDPWGAFINHSLFGKIIAPYMCYKTKKIVKKAPYVLYVTNKFLQKKYPTTGKSIKCSNVELKDILEEYLEKRLKKIENKKKNEEIIISTIAAVDVKYKGQEYVIKAIAKLNKNGYNFRYLIVGNGDQIRLKKIARKYRVEDSVEFLGGLAHDKVFELLDKVDIYAQPSVAAEGLPRAMIEAMSRGCLCIGSRISGIPELIDTKYIFKRKSEKEIEKILKGITKDNFIKEAKRNFDVSKKYDVKILRKRRKNFFEKFKNQV